MQARAACPICGQKPKQVFSCGFDEPAMARVLERVPYIRSELAKLTFSVDCCPACDFYYQRFVVAEGDLPELYLTQEGPELFVKAIADQKLHWLAHMTEEILVMRQLLDRPYPKVLDFGSN